MTPRRRIELLKERIANGAALPGDVAMLAQLEADIARASFTARPASTGGGIELDTFGMTAFRGRAKRHG